MKFMKLLGITICGLMCLNYGHSSSDNDNYEQITRTVHYDDYIDESTLKEEFDSYDITHGETNVEINALKSFNKSIFDGLDLVSDTVEDEVEVFYSLTYEDNDQSVFLTATIKDENDINVIDTLPGIVSLNESGESDIMFALDDEIIWLSDFANINTVDQTGWFSNLIKKITNTLVDLGTAVVNAFKAIIKPAVRICTHLAIKVLGGENAAKIGAFFLNMGADENGVYHADFNCWQQYFGYTDFYDTVFDAATSMRSRKYAFDINNDNVSDYILWSWKGDYLNLGAGAELGIYERWDYSDSIWKVNKSLAMTMTLELTYNNAKIIDWKPTQKQWWITGFNPKYLDVDRDALTAFFTVTFNNYNMYNNFYSTFKKDTSVSKISGYKLGIKL